MTRPNSYMYSEMASQRFVRSAFKEHRKDISTINKIYRSLLWVRGLIKEDPHSVNFSAFTPVTSSRDLAYCCAIVSLGRVHSKNLLA